MLQAILRFMKKQIIECVKVIVVMIVLFTLLIALLLLWCYCPPSHIREMTGFQCCGFAIRKYDFDAVGYGRECDSLYIYSLFGIDRARFLRYVKDNPAWKPLPLDDTAQSDDIGDEEYDPHMEEMLSVKKGYWFHEEGHRLYIFDQETGMLYMRRATNLTDHKWRDERSDKPAKNADYHFPFAILEADFGGGIARDQILKMSHYESS